MSADIKKWQDSCTFSDMQYMTRRAHAAIANEIKSLRDRAADLRAELARALPDAEKLRRFNAIRAERNKPGMGEPCCCEFAEDGESLLTCCAAHRALIAAARPAVVSEGQAVADETGWLVEWHDHGLPIHYLKLAGWENGIEFGHLEHAVRFARKEDADAAMAVVQRSDKKWLRGPPRHLRVAEHMWTCPAAPAPEAPTAAPSARTLSDFPAPLATVCDKPLDVHRLVLMYRTQNEVRQAQDAIMAATTAPTAAQAPEVGALPPPELTWLYTHCRAIGMDCKSDSREWEHDIALFTINQQNRITELEALVTQPKAAPCAFPERDQSKPAEQQGLFRKFEVRRVDGSDQPGGKHYGCRYYVLDLDHDPHAGPAMAAYAESCRFSHHQLSDELRAEFGAAPVAEAPTAFDFRAHLARQAAFSLKTFGPGARTAGVCDHIRKELLEIESDPLDLKEWVDVVILALDGAWRCGGSPSQIIDGIVAKQTKNEGRNWPDWRTADPNKAIEHDRSGEPVTAPATEQEKASDMLKLIREVDQAGSVDRHACPFCGDTDPVAYPNDTATRGAEMGYPGKDAFYLHCDSCGADGPVKDSEFEAIAAWNCAAQASPAKPDLSGLTRYDGGIIDHEYGAVGLVPKPVGRAVLLADVEALLAAITKETGA